MTGSAGSDRPVAHQLSCGLMLVYRAGNTISRGYTLPRSKQGINDQRFFIDQGLSYANQAGRKQRYATLVAQIAPGVRRYNIFWNTLESSNVMASSDPNLLCPSGYTKVSVMQFGHSQCCLLSAPA